MLNIGTFDTGTNIFLAPLAGCTDLPFRLIAREHGARFCFYEMLDANSITHNRRQSFEILNTTKEDSPIAAQVLGAEPEIVLEASLKILERSRPAILDLNCACPAKKVIKKKAGAHLLRDTSRLYAILKKIVPSVGIPVTMKIRTGFDATDARHIVTLARHCQDLGVAAISVHGRFARQGYAGDVDYECIRKIKESVRIPVIGSGNVFSPQLAKKMFDETGCDGIMVARGALGNPWIFGQIERYLKDGSLPKEIGADEKKSVLKRHLEYLKQYRNMSRKGTTGFMRKIAMWYLKGLPQASRIREKVMRASGYDEIIRISSAD
jgi:nifR3 family TIM-barrel protein